MAKGKEVTAKRKEYLRKYQNRWMQARRQKWLEANGPCVQCGSGEKLEVDHIDPKQKTSHRIWSWAEPKRQEELKLCQILCKRCHKQKSDGAKMKVTDEQIMMTVASQDISIRKMAAHLGISHPRLVRRLQKLRREGRVEKTVVGQETWVRSPLGTLF